MQREVPDLQPAQLMQLRQGPFPGGQHVVGDEASAAAAARGPDDSRGTQLGEGLPCRYRGHSEGRGQLGFVRQPLAAGQQPGLHGLFDPAAHFIHKPA